jgi:hypothetical protein
VFDPRRTDQLAACFGAVAADQRKAVEMGSHARRKVADYSLSLFGSRAAAVIRRLIGESSSRGRMPGPWTHVLGQFERALY